MSRSLHRKCRHWVRVVCRIRWRGTDHLNEPNRSKHPQRPNHPKGLMATILPDTLAEALQATLNPLQSLVRVALPVLWSCQSCPSGLGHGDWRETVPCLTPIPDKRTRKRRGFPVKTIAALLSSIPAQASTHQAGVNNMRRSGAAAVPGGPLPGSEIEAHLQEKAVCTAAVGAPAMAGGFAPAQG